MSNWDDFSEDDDEIEVIQPPVLKRAPNGDKIAIARADGTAITEKGNLVAHDWFKKLDTSSGAYASLELTAAEARALSTARNILKTGASAAQIMTCHGPQICVIAASCQPPGTMILTTKHGEVPVEQLDSEIHRLVAFRKSGHLILGKQGGYGFQKFSKEYSGTLFTLATESGKSHDCTSDHICFAMWRPSAIERHCVYLMQRGEFFRVGRTKLILPYKRNLQFGPSGRMSAEKGDRLWILGSYDTVVEAGLAEEYFSCFFGVPKALFIASDRSCWDGITKWVTQEQLNAHHLSLKKSIKEISVALATLGLLYEYPILFRDKQIDPYVGDILGSHRLFEIRACNMLSDQMDVITFDNELHKEKVSITKREYEGTVYSLDVEKYRTYIANQIVTHNCPLVQIQRGIDREGGGRNVVPVGKKCPFETEVFSNTVESLAREFSVGDSHQNFTDQQVVLELAEIAVLEYRVNSQLANDPQLQGLTEDKLTSIVQTTAGPVENYVKDVADLVKIKEKLSNRKDKLRKELVATRREQRLIAAKEGEVTNDPSVQMAALMAKFNEVTRK